MSKAKIRRRFINDLGEARTCGCGGINLVLGPMTLHFAAEEVDALVALATGARDLRDLASGKSSASSSEEAAAVRGRSHANRPLH